MVNMFRALKDLKTAKNFLDKSLKHPEDVTDEDRAKVFKVYERLGYKAEDIEKMIGTMEKKKDGKDSD